MYVAAGQEFTATLVDPGGLDDLNLGARIEVPVTRAIVGFWRAATLSGYVWTVVLEAPPAQGPVGTDPALDAALKAGEFNIVWLDDLDPPTFEAYVPLFTYTGTNGTAPPPPNGGPTDWPFPDLTQCTPTVDDVALLERTRTFADGDEEFTTFNDQTRPTADEVTALIAQSVPVVLAQFRPTFPEALYDEVSHCVALYTAVLIEGSFFREQLSEGSVALYNSLFTQAVTGVAGQIQTALDQALSGAGTSGGGGLRLA